MKPSNRWGRSLCFRRPLGTDNFDFLVEGVPTITAIQVQPAPCSIPRAVGTPDRIDIADLKNNTAIVAVTAFGIAERAAPIGPRQSRAEIESLLNASGLDEQMKPRGCGPLGIRRTRTFPLRPSVGQGVNTAHPRAHRTSHPRYNKAWPSPCGLCLLLLIAHPWA